MPLYGMENFAFGTVATAFDASQTTLAMSVGVTSRFTKFPARASLYNSTDFATIHEAFVAGDAEIVELVSKSGDNFDVIIRGRDGTTPIVSTPGKTYILAVVATDDQWDKVCRAQPDGAGPFLGTLSGTPGDISAFGLPLVIFSGNVFNNHVASIQGHPGLTTKLLIGTTDEPDLMDFRVSKDVISDDLIQMIFKGISFLRMEGNGGLAFLKAAGVTVDGQAQFGATTAFDKLKGNSSSFYAISSGAVTTTTHTIRASAEGGPGVDNFDEILVDLAERPGLQNRIIVMVTVDSGAETITVRDKSLAGGSANLTLLVGNTFVMNSVSQRIAFINDNDAYTGWTEIWRSPAPPGLQNYVLIRDEKSSGTDGGTFTSGSWQTRDLNTEVNDTDALASVAANQITLQPGTYRANITAPANAVLDHKIRLQNITGGVTTLVGSSEFADKSTTSRIRGLFTIGAATVFEVQHQSSATQGTDGFGVASGFGVVEVYCIAEFRRID